MEQYGAEIQLGVAIVGRPPHSGHEDGIRQLWMMGWETANMHLGTPTRGKGILADLGRRNGTWLSRAAERMSGAVARDWRKRRKGIPSHRTVDA